tara:strand:- start:874 stop:1707 length:834 start_codon:yes stop_codon:yes gene_type:complete
MNYKKGHKIKPDGILSDGRVIFTDGTNTVLPNQISCEAYGYKWNEKEGTCTAFNYTNKIARLNKGVSVTKTDKTNIEEGGTKNTTIIGANNTLKGQNTNVLVSGINHQVESGISNASVIGGTYGKVKTQGEVVIGGGKGLGLNQTSIVQFEGLTTDDSATNLTVQGVSSSYITVQNNSIIGFEVKVAAISSGGGEEVAAGSYEYTELKGAVVIDNGYNTTFSQSTTGIARTASLGSVVMADVTDPYITVRVTGTAGVNIEWFASVQLTEKKLTTVTF